MSVAVFGGLFDGAPGGSGAFVVQREDPGWIAGESRCKAVDRAEAGFTLANLETRHLLAGEPGSLRGFRLCETQREPA
jgi:hypothetical protein